MTAGIKANVDGSAAVQVGGTDVITLTSGGAATFVTSPTTVQAGTVSAPSITTAGDTNTGIFFPAADTIAFTEGGTEALRINSSAQVEFVAGSASTPSFTFTGDANTGIYSPGADRIGFTDGGTQVGEFDASGNFLFNSGYGSAAIAYGCRAWVNFNGTTNVGGFCTIRASGNVSSVADNGTGDYTVNFSSAMPNADYAVTVSQSISSGGGATIQFTREDLTARTASAFRTRVANTSATAVDSAQVNVAIFR
jgi:hypothetical protein